MRQLCAQRVRGDCSQRADTTVCGRSGAKAGATDRSAYFQRACHHRPLGPRAPLPRTAQSPPELQEYPNHKTRTPSCCLPPGIAQEARQRAPTLDHLLGEEFSAFCFGVAVPLSLSIAYIEKRHARHRRLSGPQMPWHVFSAVSLNTELREQSMARLACRTNLLEQPGASCQNRGGHARGILRAQTPLELFKWDRLQMLRSTGESRNPASKEFWAECRSLFAALPQAELDRYKQRAEVSRTISQANRRAKKLALQADGESGSASGAIADDTQGHAAQASAVVAVPTASAGSCCVLNSAVLERADDIDLRACLPAGAPAAEYPLERRVLEECIMPAGRGATPASGALHWRSAGATTGVKQCVAEWQRRSAAMCPDGGQPMFDMPAKVLYPAVCGDVCKSRHSHKEQRLHQRLLAASSALVAEASPNGKRSKVGLANVVLAFEVFGDLRSQHPLATEFAAVPVAMGRWHRHAESQMLCRLSPCGARALPPPPYTGLELQHEFCVFVHPQKDHRPPLCNATCGALQISTEDAFCASLLRCGADGSLPERVIVRRLRSKLALDSAPHWALGPREGGMSESSPIGLLWLWIWTSPVVCPSPSHSSPGAQPLGADRGGRHGRRGDHRRRLECETPRAGADR